ncbi:unnamed protein product [Orchesella dallaii]|uniref:Uncharacterized protein n=1 Tax=Orchesella dallaii TaxID=48710 RepID=A0ABP1RY07_9HEXA
MGAQPTRLQKTSLESQEPEMLQKDSLDLIYIDDFFDDPRYLKALDKHNRKVKVQQTKAMKRVANQTKSRLKMFQAMSDSFLTKKRRTPKSSRSRSHSPKRPATYSISKKPPPKTPPKTPPATSSKSAVSVVRKNASSTKTTAPSQTRSVTASKPSSGGRQVYAAAVPPAAIPVKSSTTASKQVGPSINSFPSTPSSKIPIRSIRAVPPVPPNSKTVTAIPPSDKKNQASSSCFGNFFHSPPSVTSDDVARAAAPKSKTATKTATGDHPQGHGKHHVLPPLPLQPAAQLRKPRSAFTNSSVGTGRSSTNPPHRSYDDIAMRKVKPTPESKTRPTSLNRNWAPSSSAAAAPTKRPVTTVISRASQGSSAADSNSSRKKKLVVRGLQHYVNTHRRSGPSLWDKEFPHKSKFHPDNYIYEHEGPRCPPRPCSAMAKCRKHGGRCDVCGIFTCDLCQRCRKCELDCCCPKAPPCPNPMNMYSEMFGDGWKKTCKVITDLTEKDKSNPVGGNANKRRQVCQSLNNQEKNQGCYQPHQIDVLNPYGLSCEPNQHQFPMPGPYGPFCPPPMLPYMPSMTYMPMPVPMMPPPMPFYPPPYDPYMCPSPYPPSDSFIPSQNYQ